MLLAVSGLAHADVATLDPPMTKQEIQMLADLELQYKRGGLAPLSAEQKVQVIVKMRAKQAEMLGNALAMQQQGQYMANLNSRQAQAMATGMLSQRQGPMANGAMGGTPVLPSMDARTVQRTLAEHRKSARFTDFKPRRDGFLYNGKPMVDAAGEIVQYGADGATGDVAYLVQVAPDHWLLKYRNVNSPLEPMLIGQVADNGGTQTLQTVGGETSAGRVVLPTSAGAIVVREATMVNFDLLKGLRATALPEDFAVADLQQGDIAGTGFVLIERNAPATGTDESPIARLKQAKEGLMSAFKERAYDYALFNPGTGQTVPLNMSLGGKLATFMSDCQRVNAVVNKCSSMARRDSLWDQDGDPNDRHYFWSVYWFNSVHGPVAVARENGSREISVINLQTGQKVTAFRRTLGIGVWSVGPTAAGTVRVKANWPFIKRPEIEDVATVFDPAFTTVQ